MFPYFLDQEAAASSTDTGSALSAPGIGRRTRFIYQSQARPVFFAPEVTAVEKWFQPASEPVRTREPLTHSWWAGVSEPSLFVAPPALSWWRQASEPVLVPRRAQPTTGAYQGEPSLFVPEEPISLDKWWQPTQVPMLPPKTRMPGYTSSWAGVTEASLLATPPMSTWYEPASEPVRVPRRAQPTTGALPMLDYTNITVDMWYVPTAVPQMRHKPRLSGYTGSWTGVTEPSLFVAPPALSWYREIVQLPNRKRLHPATLGQSVSGTMVTVVTIPGSFVAGEIIVTALVEGHLTIEALVGGGLSTTALVSGDLRLN